MEGGWRVEGRRERCISKPNSLQVTVFLAAKTNYFLLIVSFLISFSLPPSSPSSLSHVFLLFSTFSFLLRVGEHETKRRQLRRTASRQSDVVCVRKRLFIYFNVIVLTEVCQQLQRLID